MTPEELDHVVAFCVDGAKENLARDDHLVPVGIIVYGDHRYKLMALDYKDSDASKQDIADQFIAAAKRLQAVAVVTIFDAWMAQVKELPADKRVRDLPEARDVIVVSGHMSTYQTMHTVAYVKTDKGYQFEALKDFKGMSPGHSRFTDGIFETHSITDAPQ